MKGFEIRKGALFGLEGLRIHPGTLPLLPPLKLT